MRRSTKRWPNLCPQTKDASAQGAVFAGQLVDVETASRPQYRMGLCGSCRGSHNFRSSPERFVNLSLLRLGG
jgi:hypothetical protein